MHLLLTEDNVVNQKLAARLLEKRGHNVVVAGNGREALAAMQKEKFDVVLMDVQMPEMDGIEATKMIRKLEQTSGSHVPIVAMTAHAMKGDRERCLEVGMDGYISKPLQPTDLLEVVESLGAAPGGHDARTHQSPGKETPTETLFDETESLAVVDGDRDLLRELIELFLADCPTIVADIRSAIQQGDASTLRQAAHKLAGSIRYFGALSAYHLATHLENQAATEDLAGLEEQIADLERQLAQLQSELSTYMDPTRNVS